jgi:hypothetical protein
VDDIEAIKQLKARYFRLMDTKEWETMRREVFADDVVVDTSSSGGGVIAGAAPFVAFLREAIGDVVTVHHGHMPEITITGPDSAAGIWAMHDSLVFATDPPTGMQGWGHYTEEYVREDGAWRIRRLVLTRLRVERW